VKSHEVLRDAAERVGVKALAGELRVSPALVYKWCQEADPKDPDSSGARNPLDRLSEIVRVTDDTGLLSWLCHEADGFYVRNPQLADVRPDERLLSVTQRMVGEFGELLTAVSESMADDGQITPDEADRIRRQWEALKSVGESFIVACESGLYMNQPRGRDSTDA
jgi:hypothetical protein